MTDNTQPTHENPDNNRTRPNSPNLPELDDTNPQDVTQAVSLESRTRGLPPAPPRSQQQRAIRRYPAQKQGHPVQPTQTMYRGQSPKHGRARQRRKSGLYLPLWSLALMFIIVVILAGGIIFLVLSMGSNNAPPEAQPVVILSTAIPTQRQQSFPISPATATFPPEVDTLRSPVAPLVLAGPTVVTPVISPTPRPITIGEVVIVSDVGVQELNIRDSAGVIDTSIIFRAPEGTRFTIMDGPRQSDGLTWWLIEDVLNSTRRGWAASNYLIPETASDDDLDG